MPKDNIANTTSDKKKDALYDDETPPISSQDDLKTIKAKAKNADAPQADSEED